jgi:predicted nuclease of restriction endonuclease-like (RecB) superfamily
MRAFAETWPEESIVQQVVGQIPWGHNARLLDLVKDPEERFWYAQQTLANGWSRNIPTVANTIPGDALVSFAPIE